MLALGRCLEIFLRESADDIAITDEVVTINWERKQEVDGVLPERIVLLTLIRLMTI